MSSGHTQSANYNVSPQEFYDEGQTRRVPGDPSPVGVTDRQHGSNYSAHNTPASASAHTQDRPLDTKPTSAGGVATDGHAELPEGKASMMDKAVGKTEKVAGKVTGNPERHGRGELREAGGEAAVYGGARAPHD